MCAEGAGPTLQHRLLCSQRDAQGLNRGFGRRPRRDTRAGPPPHLHRCDGSPLASTVAMARHSSLVRWLATHALLLRYSANSPIHWTSPTNQAIMMMRSQQQHASMRPRPPRPPWVTRRAGASNVGLGAAMPPLSSNLAQARPHHRRRGCRHEGHGRASRQGGDECGRAGLPFNARGEAALRRCAVLARPRGVYARRGGSARGGVDCGGDCQCDGFRQNLAVVEPSCACHQLRVPSTAHSPLTARRRTATTMASTTCAPSA